MYTKMQNRKAQTIMKKKSKVGCFTLPYVKIYYKAQKSVWYWCSDRPIGQWNRMKSRARRPHTVNWLLIHVPR